MIQETKMSKEKVEEIKIFKNGGVEGSESEGASRGMSIFWNLNQVIGNPLFNDNNLVSIRFTLIRDRFAWIATNIYAPNSKTSRKSFLEIN